MKPLVVLFLFWLHAGPQWISVGCGRTLISWTRTLYMLQIVQCSLSLELRGTWDMALFPFIPPPSSAVPAIRWSCPSIHLILQSLEQNTKSAGFHICQIPFWSSPPPRRELFDLFSIMACSALTGAASFIIPPIWVDVRQGKGKQKPDQSYFMVVVSPTFEKKLTSLSLFVRTPNTSQQAMS